MGTELTGTESQSPLSALLDVDIICSHGDVAGSLKNVMIFITVKLKVRLQHTSMPYMIFVGRDVLSCVSFPTYSFHSNS